MSKVSVKKLLIYKSHIFPQAKKPIRSFGDYFMFKNPDMEILKAKKMSQLLNEQERKKLKTQIDQINDAINIDLQKYYRSYIQPFQSCPDYYNLLFQYALKKTEIFSQNNQNQNTEEPFHMNKKKIASLVKTITNLEQKQQPLNQNKGGFDSSILTKSSQQKGKSSKEQKLLFNVYQHLYPSQKQHVYNRFIQLYKNFLINYEDISRQLLKNEIVHIKPFIFNTPLQLYQSKHQDKGLKQCEKILINDVNERDKTNVEYLKLLHERKKEVDFIESKYQIEFCRIWNLYRRQYYQAEQYRDFYSMLKSY